MAAVVDETVGECVVADVVVECAAAGGAGAAADADAVAAVDAAETVADADDAVLAAVAAAGHVVGIVFVFAASAIATEVGIVVKDVKSPQTD